MDNPSYFIFPLLTCISFYNKQDPSQSNATETISNDQNVEIGESTAPIPDADDLELGISNESNPSSCDIELQSIEERSMASINEASNESRQEENKEIVEHQVVVVEESEETETSQHVEEEEEDVSTDDFQFSSHQSNFLYFLFSLSFAIIIGADIALQTARWGWVAVDLFGNSILKYLIIFILNLCLWLDFIRGVHTVNDSANITSGNIISQ